MTKEIRKSGVPSSNVGTWGIKYSVTEIKKAEEPNPKGYGMIYINKDFENQKKEPERKTPETGSAPTPSPKPESPTKDIQEASRNMNVSSEVGTNIRGKKISDAIAGDKDFASSVRSRATGLGYSKRGEGKGKPTLPAPTSMTDGKEHTQYNQAEGKVIGTAGVHARNIGTTGSRGLTQAEDKQPLPPPRTTSSTTGKLPSSGSGAPTGTTSTKKAMDEVIMKCKLLRVKSDLAQALSTGGKLQGTKPTGGKCVSCGKVMGHNEYAAANHDFNKPKEGEKVCNNCYDKQQ
jgi:hypothetical protein